MDWDASRARTITTGKAKDDEDCDVGGVSFPGLSLPSNPKVRSLCREHSWDVVFTENGGTDDGPCRGESLYRDEGEGEDVPEQEDGLPGVRAMMRRTPGVCPPMPGVVVAVVHDDDDEFGSVMSV